MPLSPTYDPIKTSATSLQWLWYIYARYTRGIREAFLVYAWYTRGIRAVYAWYLRAIRMVYAWYTLVYAHDPPAPKW